MKEENVYKPDLSKKKLSDLKKVELLEEVVQKGTLEDLKDVLETYKNFELTARALGIAARYRGIDYVKVLMEHGARFEYFRSGKYKTIQNTAAGEYDTDFYLMIVPEHIHFDGKEYDYSPMYGVSKMKIQKGLKPLSLEQRIEVSRFFAENRERLNVSMDEILFWALSRGELEFADALMEMGVNLQDKHPTYYRPKRCHPRDRYKGSYLNLITEGVQCSYWNDYVNKISSLEETKVLPVLERFHRLAQKIGKKLLISQKMFDEAKWNNASAAFILENTDISKISQKQCLEMAVVKKVIPALEVMAQDGWLENANRREGLIKLAQENKCIESLAWLLEFKNKTVDIVAERVKEEAKMMRELNEKPDSVSALKKIWGYKKLEDGTLCITGYKGTMLEVEIPQKIGKSMVSVIGSGAFACGEFASKRITNKEIRKKITSVVIPEGVTTICYEAFEGCEALSKIVIPSTLKTVNQYAFWRCKALEEITIPQSLNMEKKEFLSMLFL